MTTIKEIQKIQDERFEEKLRLYVHNDGFRQVEGYGNEELDTDLIKSYLHERDQAIIEGMREKIKILGYIIKDIKGYSLDGEIETLCIQADDILSDLT